MRRTGLAVSLLVVLASSLLPAPLHASEGCAAARNLVVPGAEHVESACLPELTTAGTIESGHTDRADWAGLTPTGLPTPRGVPGIQLDGYFPDRSRTNTNTAGTTTPSSSSGCPSGGTAGS